MSDDYKKPEIQIRASNLYKIYQNSSVATAVIKGISVNIRKGEKVLLVGPSGCGKTTLISMLFGTIKPDAGQLFWGNSKQNVSILDKNALIRIRRGFIALINQKNNLLPQLSVRDNILLSAKITGIEDDLEEHMGRLVDLLEIRPLLNQSATTLSQGEKKRVNIAAALITNPDILIADEPVESLDPVIADHILELLDNINKELGTTLIMTTHDQSVANRADRVLELSNGVLLGAHDNSVDFVDLSKSRRLIIDSDRRIVIPEDILNSLNNPTVFKLRVEGNSIIMDSDQNQSYLSKKSEYYQCLICKTIQDTKQCVNCGNATVYYKS